MELISENPINPTAMYDLVAKNSSGSVVFHYAVVKEQQSHDKATIGIEYQSAGDTEAELRGIAAELKQGWQLEDVLLVRRTGTLQVGDIISLIAASSPNSEDAFASCRHGISLMKKMAAIRKNEMYG